MQRVASNALVLPRGFEISLFADNVDGVRFMAFGPEGAVYATAPRAGLVLRIGAGIDTVLQGLRHPHGLAFRGDTLYVAEEHRVVSMVPPETAVEVVVPTLPAGEGHSTRTVIFRGDEMLVSVGSSCNLCEERDTARAAVLRYDPLGGNGRLFATGLRNSVGLAVHPETGAIWATNNDRDRLGDDLPPDRLNVLVDGGFYGWPFCYLPNRPNPEYRGRADTCRGAVGPAVTFPAHSAPLGLAFYTGVAFPEEYRGSLFVALHGSWDRSFPVGYKVVRIPMVEGQPAGEPEDFVVGWQVGRRSWGRPVDLLVLPDGSLLISDDQGGRIYRIAYGDP